MRQLYRFVSFLGGIGVALLLLIRNLINRVFSPPVGEAVEEDGVTARRRVGRVRGLTLLAFVISEGIGLLGFLLILMGGQRRVLYIFCAIALACLILFFPRNNH